MIAFPEWVEEPSATMHGSTVVHEQDVATYLMGLGFLPPKGVDGVGGIIIIDDVQTFLESQEEAEEEDPS